MARRRAASAQQAQHECEDQSDDSTLPERMEQRQAEALSERHKKRRIHNLRSSSLRSLRISRSSAAETLPAPSACNTSSWAEPPKARSMRSRTICFFVRSAGIAGA